MDWYSYGDDRWEIRCGNYQGEEQRAAEMLYAGVSDLVPYILVADTVKTPHECSDASLLLVGTYESNPLIAQAIKKNEIPQDGYLVKVMPSCFCKGRQLAILAGSTPAQAIYAVSHFINEYIPIAKQNETHIPYFKPVFKGAMLEYSVACEPAFQERGIWTWGHCIYDFRRFAQNMARLRLNVITIWNDYVPLNIAQVVQCFHEYGIKVIFGYSWGWDEGVDIGSLDELARWRDKAVAVYERDYASVGGDGIYIQSFTETSDDNINGVSIADSVVSWVNTVGAAMLERWPSLKIQFGLHATSVKNHLETISQIDPRIAIIWEDCGAFPYSYLSRDVSADNPLTITQEISALRTNGAYGAVLKGQVCLDWNMFEHQKGPYVLGCASDEKRRARLEEIRPQWHDVQSYWIQNIDVFRRTLDDLRGATVYSLVEDALLEDYCWYPVALYAELLWNNTPANNELLRIVAQRADVTMA